MKRTTIVAVLALFSAVATTGCFTQSGGGESTDESEQSSRGSHDSTDGDERNSALLGGPQHALDLDLHPSTDRQGPHPEPWLKVMGPHPEPWEGNLSESDPNKDPNSDPNAPSGASKP